MGLMRIIILTIAISMAITIVTISVNHSSHVQKAKEENVSTMHEEIKPMPSKRMSRFLKENYDNKEEENDKKKPHPADHCHKDKEICHSTKGYNTTCCNNTCMNLSEDIHNCGACKNRCKFTQMCCRGKCVNTNYDKRHCGSCNHGCRPGEYCVYGMCNYA